MCAMTMGIPASILRAILKCIRVMFLAVLKIDDSSA
jgi:hypothetical protein